MPQARSTVHVTGGDASVRIYAADVVITIDPDASLLAAAVPVVLLDPNIRHPREHLPFDVELPLGGDPRQVIAAIRHLAPSH